MKGILKAKSSLTAVALLTALMVLTLLPSQGVAGKYMSRIQARGVLTVGTTGHFPPFTVKDKMGNYIGLDMQLAKYMAEAMEVKLDVKRYDMDHLIDAVSKGKVDMALAGITMTLKRNEKVVFIGPYAATGQSILAKMNVVQKVNQDSSYMNNPSFKLVVVKGTTGAMVAKAVLPKATIIEKEKMTDAFDMVLKNKADALMADQSFCVVSSFQHQNQGIGVSEPITSEPVGVALPDGDYLLVNWVENFLNKMHSSGILEKMKKYWFSNPSWIKKIPKQQ